MSAKFAIVTDSTADLPAEFYARHDVRVVPLHVTFGTDEYVDGVSISREEFLDRMAATPELPRTSQPTPADFMLAYQALIAEGWTRILSIHIASVLSGTCAAARQIADACSKDGVRIEVVDARITTAGQGVMVAEAVAARDAGAEMGEAAARVERIRDSSNILFVPKSLENLVKGGRMSSAAGLMASLLDIKPVILVDDMCRLSAPAKCRGMRAAASKAVKMLARRARELGGLAYVVLEARSAESVLMLERIMRGADELASGCMGVLTIGPAIATHIGAGSIGVWSCASSAVSPAAAELVSACLPQPGE